MALEKNDEAKNKTLGLRVAIIDHEIISNKIREENLSGEEAGCLISSLLLNHFKKENSHDESRYIKLEISKNFERLQTYIMNYLNIANERMRLGDESNEKASKIVIETKKEFDQELKNKNENIKKLENELETLYLKLEDRETILRAKSLMIDSENKMVSRLEEIGLILNDVKNEKAYLENENATLKENIKTLVNEKKAEREVANRQLKKMIKHLKANHHIKKKGENAMKKSITKKLNSV